MAKYYVNSSNFSPPMRGTRKQFEEALLDEFKEWYAEHVKEGGEEIPFHDYVQQQLDELLEEEDIYSDVLESLPFIR